MFDVNWTMLIFVWMEWNMIISYQLTWYHLWLSKIHTQQSQVYMHIHLYLSGQITIIPKPWMIFVDFGDGKHSRKLFTTMGVAFPEVHIPGSSNENLTVGYQLDGWTNIFTIGKWVVKPSKNRGGKLKPPKSSICSQGFTRNKPSIFRYHYFWKHPNCWKTPFPSSNIPFETVVFVGGVQV